MANIAQTIRRNLNTIIIFLPILSFIPPFLILYSLHAWTFEQAYHGRTFLLFFLWLVVLEIIMSWEKLRKNKVNRLLSIRTVLFVMTLLLPTIYVVVANYYGLNAMITNLTSQYVARLNIDATQKLIIASQMPISIEFLVFTVLFCLTIPLVYGVNVLADFSLSALFLGTIGLLFTMDELYPQKLTPLQIFVPSTATIAENVFKLMGYHTSMSFESNMPILLVIDPKNSNRFAFFGIDWTCAGVESLLIYTVIMLLFLRKTAIPWMHRIIYFVIGAVVTYFINIFRVVTIFLIGMDYGANSVEFQMFHNYYGMLYSISWIVSYPLIVIGIQVLWGRISHWKTGAKKTPNFSAPTKLSG
jgi:thaumarchaeosortase